MKNFNRLFIVLSFLILCISTITIYGYESSKNQNSVENSAGAKVVTYENSENKQSKSNATTQPPTTNDKNAQSTTVTTTKDNVVLPTTKPQVTDSIKSYKPIKSITLDKKAIRLNKGDTRNLTTYIKYKKSAHRINEPIIWTSANKKIATVSKKGNVKGKSKGTTYIKVTSKFTKKSATCKVTVDKTNYVAFTFDDGPGIYTNKLLSALDKNDSKATFFVLGSRAKSFKKQLKKAYDLHMEIGNHTYNHKNLNTLSKSQIKKEISSTNKAIKKITGQNPTLLRPPFGNYNKTVSKNTKVPMIYWSVDTEDWTYRNTNYVSKTILKQTSAWDIVLLHDIHKTSVDGFVKALPKLRKKGYELVTVSELYELKGKKMKAGVMYFGPTSD